MPRVIIAVLVSSLFCSFLGACASGGNKYSYGYYSGKTPPAAVSIEKTKGDYYTVKKGDTLYSIAWAYGQDVRQMASWNRLRKPYTIYPKQKIRVTPTNSSKKQSTSNNKKKTNSNTHKKRAKNDDKITWHWPTNGKIISSFSANDSRRKGIDISGKAGQPIYAAAGGRVVYTGTGLRGYGNLIIIKHNDTYFSAYAHNRRINIKEEQRVKKGQRIADMGSSGTDKVKLHFEVRRNGKPVDPVKYLPKRR